MKKIFLVDNIRSLLNIGAIFRTCDGAWFDRLILTGYSPIPPRKEISKTALWAEKFVDWEYYKDPIEAIKILRKDWFKILVLEQYKKSIDIRDLISLKENICIIAWNEVWWVNPEILKLADYIVEIPMLGKKQSLNVAVSAGIIMYKLLDF
jgi:tRNA G18 (ribose-2'-O)-methylase SpoU